jgi:hypothetical protein
MKQICINVRTLQFLLLQHQGEKRWPLGSVGLAIDLTHTRGHQNSGEGDNTHKDLPVTNTTEHELLYLGFSIELNWTWKLKRRDKGASCRPGTRQELASIPTVAPRLRRTRSTSPCPRTSHGRRGLLLASRRHTHQHLLTTYD